MSIYSSSLLGRDPKFALEKIKRVVHEKMFLVGNQQFMIQAHLLNYVIRQGQQAYSTILL